MGSELVDSVLDDLGYPTVALFILFLEGETGLIQWDCIDSEGLAEEPVGLLLCGTLCYASVVYPKTEEVLILERLGVDVSVLLLLIVPDVTLVTIDSFTVDWVVVIYR